MTATELLNIVAAQIAATDTSRPGIYGVYVTDKQLHCGPISKRKPDDLLIAVYSKKTVDEGYAGHDWNHLEAQLRKLRREGLL